MAGRPVLEAALALVRSDGCDGLLVAKLDRLTRSTRDLGELLDDASRRGWSLMSVGEQLDTTAAGGRLMVNILRTVAQRKREASSGRMAYLVKLAKSGVDTFGGDPFGLTEWPKCAHCDRPMTFLSHFASDLAHNPLAQYDGIAVFQCQNNDDGFCEP